MASQKKSRKGPGKVKNLAPRKAAGRKDQDVKGGYGTTGVISGTPLQPVGDVAATYDMLSKLSQDAHDTQQQIISNIRA